jgi:preprotein translocase subunit SecE
LTAVKAIISYIKDVRYELSKVVWPKRDEVIKLTLIVFIISGAVSIYVGGLDLVFTKVLGLVISR